MSFNPINVEFLINNEAVKTASDKVKKNLMDIGFTAEEAEKKINQKLNAALEKQAFKTMPALDQAGAKTKSTWNGLGNSINQLSREMPAFAVSAQTGFLAISNNLPTLADEIQRLRDKNAALVASGEKGVPVWKQVVKGLLSWQTALSVGVALLTVYGAELVKFFQNVFKGAAKLDVAKERWNALTKAFESTSYKKARTEISELYAVLKLATEGKVNAKVAIDKYNKSLGKTAGSVETLAGLEQGLIDNADAYIRMTLYKSAAVAGLNTANEKIIEQEVKKIKIEKDLEKLREQQRKALQAEAEGKTGTDVADANKIRLNKQIKELEKAQKEIKDIEDSSLELYNSILAKAADIANEFNLKLFGGEEENNKPTKTASKYQSLIDKIAEIDKEYTRKSFTKDEEELQALADKFSKIRTLVERFNADPKNKAQIIDLTAFNSLETQATADVTFRQETDKLKTEIAEKKKLYQEYETFKKTFGTAKAKEEFAGKITEAETYYDYLKKLERDNKTAFSAVKNNTATGGQTERVNFVNTALQKETKAQQTEFNKQLEGLLTYHERRKTLIENHEKRVADLQADGKKHLIIQAEKNHKEDLDKLDDANIKKLESFKALQRGIVGLTKQEAKVIIDNAKALLDKVNISDDLRAKIEEAVTNLEQQITNQRLDNLFLYTQRLGEFGTALTDLGTALGSSDVRNAGAFLSGIAGGLDTFFDALKASKTEGIADDVSAGINAAISLISTFTSAAAKRKQAEEAYYLNVIGFQNEYNIALQEQKRLQSELAENIFATDYAGRLQDGMDAIFSANQGLQDAISNLKENGEAVSGQRNAIGWGNVGSAAANGAALGSLIAPGIGTVVGAIGGLIGGLLFGGTKKDEMTAILKEYPKLIKVGENGLEQLDVKMAEFLISNNLVKGETKAILENVIAWQEQLDEAREQVKGVVSELVGDFGDDLRDSLVEAFKAGEDAGTAMMDSIEKSLDNIISNMIFSAVFNDALTKLEENLGPGILNGNSSEVFASFFTSASALTEDFNKAMEDAQAEASALGFSIFDNAQSPNSLTGGVTREITEQTGTELLGLFRGFYDLSRFNLEQMEAYIEAEKGHHNTTLQILAINTQIEANTRQMVLEIIKSNQFLENIDDTSTKTFLLGV